MTLYTTSLIAIRVYIRYTYTALDRNAVLRAFVLPYDATATIYKTSSSTRNQ